MSAEQCGSVQAQAAAVRQVGRGGLNEQAGSSNQDVSEEGPSGGQRRGETTAVSTTEIVRHPSETEQVLRILAAQLRALKHLSPQTGQHPHPLPPPPHTPSLRQTGCAVSVSKPVGVHLKISAFAFQQSPGPLLPVPISQMILPRTCFFKTVLYQAQLLFGALSLEHKAIQAKLSCGVYYISTYCNCFASFRCSKGCCGGTEQGSSGSAGGAAQAVPAQQGGLPDPACAAVRP